MLQVTVRTQNDSQVSEAAFVHSKALGAHTYLVCVHVCIHACMYTRVPSLVHVPVDAKGHFQMRFSVPLCLETGSFDEAGAH